MKILYFNDDGYPGTRSRSVSEQYGSARSRETSASMVPADLARRTLREDLQGYEIATATAKKKRMLPPLN